MATIEIGKHRHNVAYRQPGDTLAQGRHGAGNLMPRHAGIGDKRVQPPIGSQVGAAITHKSRIDGDLARTGFRNRDLHDASLAGLLNGQCLHVVLPFDAR